MSPNNGCVISSLQQDIFTTPSSPLLPRLCYPVISKLGALEHNPSVYTEGLVPSPENANHPLGASPNEYSLADTSRFLPLSHLLAPTDLAPFCIKCSVLNHYHLLSARFFSGKYRTSFIFLKLLVPSLPSTQQVFNKQPFHQLAQTELKKWENATSVTVEVGLNKKNGSLCNTPDNLQTVMQV